MEAKTYLIQIQSGDLETLIFDCFDKAFKLNSTASEADPDRWFDVNQLCAYLPDKPSHTTVYGWAQANAVLHGRNGKKLIFRKSEIDAWLVSKSRKTTAQTATEAIQYCVQQSPAMSRQRKTKKAV